MKTSIRKGMTILIDTREQRPLDFAPFSGSPMFGEVRQRVKGLGESKGDYAVDGFEGELAFERKSISDLVQTVGELIKAEGAERSGLDPSLAGASLRFRRELEYLASIRLGVVIIEGAESDLRCGRFRSQWDPCAILAKMDSLLVRYKVPFFFCGDRHGAARRVVEIARAFIRESERGVSEPPAVESVCARPPPYSVERMPPPLSVR
ncbi:MAG: hypothetical protein HUK22_02610 [Thermoguttaceae bacterium]|nr:hypothetical protein [Thermoguttaceae bacterium]